jgi:hypothetical protein
MERSEVRGLTLINRTPRLTSAPASVATAASVFTLKRSKLIGSIYSTHGRFDEALLDVVEIHGTQTLGVLRKVAG